MTSKKLNNIGAVEVASLGFFWDRDKLVPKTD
jgi:hypothetical protein